MKKAPSGVCPEELLLDAYSDFPAVLHCFIEGHFIDVLEIAADGYAVGDTGGLHAEGFIRFAI